MLRRVPRVRGLGSDGGFLVEPHTPRSWILDAHVHGGSYLLSGHREALVYFGVEPVRNQPRGPGQRCYSGACLHARVGHQPRAAEDGRSRRGGYKQHEVTPTRVPAAATPGQVAASDPRYDVLSEGRALQSLRNLYEYTPDPCRATRLRSPSPNGTDTARNGASCWPVVRGEPLERPPFGFIIDSPWLPNWIGIRILVTSPATTLVRSQPPCHRNLPKSASCPVSGLKTAVHGASAFGVKCVFYPNEFPFADR